MTRTIHRGPDIPESSAPLSQVVEANGFVFVAGQVGDAPGSHGPVPGGVGPQARAMLENVRRLLNAAGLDLSDVVRSTVYLVDFAALDEYNAIYREFFPVDPPARATIGAARLVGEYLIEIEVTAARR